MKAHISTNIKTRLASQEISNLVAQVCLGSTISFITSLITYILDTNLMLANDEFSIDSSWQLVTQLADYVFTEDIDNVRSIVREAANTHDEIARSMAVLWDFLVHKE